MNFINLIATAAIVVAVILFLKTFTEKARAHASASMLNEFDRMEGWSEASIAAAETMKKKYGEPDQTTATMMIWYNAGQWKRTIIYSKGFAHDFPVPHTDVMEQCIHYKVPPEKFTELGLYNGSVTFSRTNGELSARCNTEEANILAINLAHDIISGKKDFKTAKNFLANSITQFMNGGSPEYMQKLQFDVSPEN